MSANGLAPPLQELPPELYSIEAERATLGGLMVYPEAAGQFKALGLVRGDFHFEAHRHIWQAIEQCWKNGAEADRIVVLEALRTAKVRTGGLSYLDELCQSVVSPRYTARQAGIVKEKALRRHLITMGAAIQQAATGPLGGAELRSRVDALASALPSNDGPPSARSAIPVEWAADMPPVLHAPQQIVEGVLKAGGMSMIYGESNSGKSYLAIHLGICVSLGLPFLGRRTVQGAVLYVGAEGAWSIRLRVAAHCKHFGREIGRFGLIPAALNLMDPSADVEDLIDLIADMGAELGESIVLIVVDTVARVMAGGDENSAEDMGRLVAAGDRIRSVTGAHLMYVHHAGKDASKGARGHSSLRAALDTEIEVTADEATKTHTAKITKQRDLPSKGDRISGRFVSVDLGTDQWGGAITACAVVDVEDSAQASRPQRLTPSQRAVLGFLAGHIGGIRRAKLVEALAPQGLSRPSVYRATNDLITAGLVTYTLGLLYVPKE